jgi:hypothetical protein
VTGLGMSSACPACIENWGRYAVDKPWPCRAHAPVNLRPPVPGKAPAGWFPDPDRDGYFRSDRRPGWLRDGGGNWYMQRAVDRARDVIEEIASDPELSDALDSFRRVFGADQVEVGEFEPTVDDARARFRERLRRRAEGR